jgi:hypothetical protein
MHDYFVGNFDDMELLPVRRCQKRTQDLPCKTQNVLKLNEINELAVMAAESYPPMAGIVQNQPCNLPDFSGTNPRLITMERRKNGICH